MPKLVSADPKLFPSELMLRPDQISAVEMMHDGDLGVLLRLHMLGGYIFPSYRFDGSDSAIVAKVRAARDALVDSIRVALAEDQPVITGPALQEKRSL